MAALLLPIIQKAPNRCVTQENKNVSGEIFSSDTVSTNIVSSDFIVSSEFIDGQIQTKPDGARRRSSLGLWTRPRPDRGLRSLVGPAAGAGLFFHGFQHAGVGDCVLRAGAAV